MSEEHRRIDGRAPGELREVRIERGYLDHAAGSCLITFGQTRVLCAASVEEEVPRFLRDQRGHGWVTAEYGMLPASTHSRSNREAAKGKQSGRTQEIQRLIGRALRGVVNMNKLGERTVTLDCDVIQADGGTRTAAITGAWIALVDAVQSCIDRERIKVDSYKDVVTDQVAAVSVGVVKGVPVCDLPYVEDSRAETDMNLVMTGTGDFIEIQGTAEGAPFSRETLDQLLELGRNGISELLALQLKALGASGIVSNR